MENEVLQNIEENSNKSSCGLLRSKTLYSLGSLKMGSFKKFKVYIEQFSIFEACCKHKKNVQN